MSIKRIVSTTCLSILFASPVFAQTPPDSAPQGGAAMPETKTFNVEAFVAGVDTDKDGFMTKEEFKTAGLTDRMFLTPPFCDPDHDEKISSKEMSECQLPEAVDMNDDGKLTKEEMVTFEGTSLGKERGPREAKPE